MTSPSSFAMERVLSPHAVVHGSPYDATSDVHIYIDGKPILRGRNVLDTILLLSATYYSLWLQFPKSCECTFKFLEVEIFEENTGNKLPAKLVRLMSSQNVKTN